MLDDDCLFQGFYEHGLGMRLVDLNIADDSMLNFILEANRRQNLVTPIVNEGSSIIDQFVEKNFSHGVPIVKKRNEDVPRFLNEFLRPADAGQ